MGHAVVLLSVLKLDRGDDRVLLHVDGESDVREVALDDLAKHLERSEKATDAATC